MAVNHDQLTSQAPCSSLSPPRERLDSNQDVEKSLDLTVRPVGNDSLVVDDLSEETLADQPTSPTHTNTEANANINDDVHIVFWDSPEDPANPYIWPGWRKKLDCTLISLLTFIAPLSASMLAPALPQLMSGFGSNITATNTFTNGTTVATSSLNNTDIRTTSTTSENLAPLIVS
jgi:hypothetical protein